MTTNSFDRAAQALYEAGRPPKATAEHWNLDWDDPLLGERTRDTYRDMVQTVLSALRAPLIWDTDGLGAHRAWSGQLVIGAVVLKTAGRFWFDATYAVRMRDISGAAPHCGEVESLEEGKLAIQRAWSTWLLLADLK